MLSIASNTIDRASLLRLRACWRLSMLIFVGLPLDIDSQNPATQHVYAPYLVYNRLIVDEVDVIAD